MTDTTHTCDAGCRPDCVWLKAQPPASRRSMANEVVDRITSYLASGGLFNPELMDHEAVRDLLIDARAQLAVATLVRPAPGFRPPTVTIERDALERIVRQVRSSAESLRRSARNLPEVDRDAMVDVASDVEYEAAAIERAIAEARRG